MSFPIAFDVHYHGAVPGSVQMSQREFNELKRQAWYQCGKYWLAHFREKHFTRAAYSEYGYSPRKGESGNTHPKGFWASYTGRKQREMHHTLPLVYSGHSRDVIRRSAVIRAVASSTQSRCRISMPAGNLGHRNPKSHVNMRDEMTRVSAGEERILRREYEGFITRGLAAVQGTTTRRIAA